VVLQNLINEQIEQLQVRNCNYDFHELFKYQNKANKNHYNSSKKLLMVYQAIMKFLFKKMTGSRRLRIKIEI
jgi:hypothetical protein